MLTDPVVSPESVEIRATVRKLLTQHSAPERVRVAADSDDGYDAPLWRRLTDMGLLGAAVPEELGGIGLGVRELCIVAEEIGRSLAVVPVVASAGLALPVLCAAGDAELVGPVAAGDLIATLVTPPGGARWSTSAFIVSGDDRLTGTAEVVVDAAVADRFVVVLPGVEPAVYVVPATGAGVEVHRCDTVDVTRPVGRVTFTDAPAQRLAVSPAGVERALDTGALVRAAEQVGSAERALELTLDYLRTRHQFGKPIGSMQALKHRCADAAVALTLARELVYHGADLLDAGVEDGRSVVVAAAVVRAAEVSEAVAAEAIQLHGGIGFTEEHDIGLYYRRARVEARLGESSIHARERVAVALQV